MMHGHFATLVASSRQEFTNIWRQPLSIGIDITEPLAVTEDLSGASPIFRDGDFSVRIFISRKARARSTPFV